MAGKWCSGIINLLFDGFTDNTRGHFTRCSHTQVVKYSRVLSVKPSNKVYLYLPRRSRGKYSAIFTEPEVNNCFSIIFSGEDEELEEN